MTAKFDDFIADYRALCAKHGVEIVAGGYDGLEVHTMDGIGWQSTIEDCTAPKEPEPPSCMEQLVREGREMISEGRLDRVAFIRLLYTETGFMYPYVADIEESEVVAIHKKMVALCSAK